MSEKVAQIIRFVAFTLDIVVACLVRLSDNQTFFYVMFQCRFWTVSRKQHKAGISWGQLL